MNACFVEEYQTSRLLAHVAVDGNRSSCLILNKLSCFSYFMCQSIPRKLKLWLMKLLIYIYIYIAIFYYANGVHWGKVIAQFLLMLSHFRIRFSDIFTKSEYIAPQLANSFAKGIDCTNRFLQLDDILRFTCRRSPLLSLSPFYQIPGALPPPASIAFPFSHYLALILSPQ